MRKSTMASQLPKEFTHADIFTQMKQFLQKGPSRNDIA